MVGVWTEPVTAQVMMTLFDALLISSSCLDLVVPAEPMPASASAFIGGPPLLQMIEHAAAQLGLVFRPPAAKPMPSLPLATISFK
jgi:hypothetical protein